MGLLRNCKAGFAYKYISSQFSTLIQVTLIRNRVNNVEEEIDYEEFIERYLLREQESPQWIKGLIEKNDSPEEVG